jgi:hypothetical protein
MTQQQLDFTAGRVKNQSPAEGLLDWCLMKQGSCYLTFSTGIWTSVT